MEVGRGDQTRMDNIGLSATSPELFRKGVGEEDVGGLGLPIGKPWVVRLAILCWRFSRFSLVLRFSSCSPQSSNHQTGYLRLRTPG